MTGRQRPATRLQPATRRILVQRLFAPRNLLSKTGVCLTLPRQSPDVVNGIIVQGSSASPRPGKACENHPTPMPYSVRETSFMSSETFSSPGARNQTDVFAVHGADPEILAYAMAKYSRSALSMRESLSEISSQRAEQFLNTFYFQYGHRSIADLAHIAFAVERLSLLAAIVLVDEQRWDGQERSTRYQNFMKSGWYLPDFGGDPSATEALHRNHRQPLQHLPEHHDRGSGRVAAQSGAAGSDEAGELRAHVEAPAHLTWLVTCSHSPPTPRSGRL